MTNPVAAYMAQEKIGTVELASKLGVSKGYASRLKDGGKPVTLRIAKKLGELTGRPWHSFIEGRAA